MKLSLILLLVLPVVIAGQVFTFQLPFPFFNLQLKTITAIGSNAGQASAPLKTISSRSSVGAPSTRISTMTSSRLSATPTVRASSFNLMNIPSIRASTNDQQQRVAIPSYIDRQTTMFSSSNRNHVTSPSTRSSFNELRPSTSSFNELRPSTSSFNELRPSTRSSFNELRPSTRTSFNELQTQESVRPVSIVTQNGLTNAINTPSTRSSTNEAQEQENPIPGNVARQASLLMSRNRNNFNSVSTRTSSRTSARGPSCVTPEGENGVCGHLSDCNLYIPYMELMDQPNVLTFFRDRVCRIGNMEMHVCCPTSPFAEGPQLRTGNVIPRENDCGFPSTNRLVGGEEVSVGNWPWLATIGFFRNNYSFIHICGGTLISRRHVLTAAHCFMPQDRESPTHVRLGVYDLTSADDTTFQQRKIISLRTLRYRNSTGENDIAIVILAEDVVFNDFVRPACLPINSQERDNDFTGEQVTVVGWGRTTAGARGGISYTQVPRQIDFPVVALEACRNLYRTVNLKVDTRNLCAGASGRDACRGDSGGPLNYLNQDDGRVFVIGIVSRGIGCSAYPGVYTRVGAYINWILNSLK